MATNYQVNVTTNPIQIVVASTPVGSQIARAGNISIPNGTDTVVITFPTMLPNPINNYTIIATLQNTLDAFPEDLTVRVSAFAVNGATFKLNAPTDTSSYSVNWQVVGVVNG